MGQSEANASQRVTAHRVSTCGDADTGNEELGEVAVEAALTVDVVGAGRYTTMCTPTESRALAVGFLLSEGLISAVSDIAVLAECPDAPDVIRVQLTVAPEPTDTAVDRVLFSSCGMCGEAEIAARVAALPRVGSGLRIRPSILRRAIESMRALQQVFPRTGGTHAAAVFDRTGEIIACSEDIGRHNALDKAIGTCLLLGRSPRGLGVALSGRVSLEMLAKCARAGLEVVAAVSAPTSLAISTAEACGISLCGFVRGERATVYTQRQRIVGGLPLIGDDG